MTLFARNVREPRRACDHPLATVATHPGAQRAGSSHDRVDPQQAARAEQQERHDESGGQPPVAEPGRPRRTSTATSVVDTASRTE